ncbi:MAG TPA: hypothetical protein VEP28_10830 [Rubrobacter sp.]|nr:hypothetical protein [Rubrobacter sp.]
MFGGVQYPVTIHEALGHPLVNHPHAARHSGEGGTEAHGGGAAGDVQDHILRGVAKSLELGEEVLEALEGVPDFHWRVDDPVAESGTKLELRALRDDRAEDVLG